MKKIRTTYAVATNLPVAHDKPAWDQTIGNLDSTAGNYWNATIFIGFYGHPTERKRI